MESNFLNFLAEVVAILPYATVAAAAFYLALLLARALDSEMWGKNVNVSEKN